MRVIGQDFEKWHHQSNDIHIFFNSLQIVFLLLFFPLAALVALLVKNLPAMQETLV